MKPIIETERLLIRELLPSDVDGIYALDSDPEVHKYLGNRPIKDKTQALELIQFIRQQYQENGIGRWAMVERETNQFIGWTGFKLMTELTNNHMNYYDLGYRLQRKYWGQGFAEESAIASLKYGFEILKLKEIVAMAHVDNIASNKILKKIGFQYLDTFEYDGALHNWYKMFRVE